MAKNDVIRKGKHLAFLLRHDKEAFEDGRIDRHGWRQVSELAKLGYDRSLLDEIVATNNKQRYEYSLDGILPGTRLYVHLSPDEETAINVGSRHGKPFVIKIDCQKMLANGCKFFLSNNGVWLTEKVMPEYFISK